MQELVGLKTGAGRGNPLDTQRLVINWREMILICKHFRARALGHLIIYYDLGTFVLILWWAAFVNDEK